MYERVIKISDKKDLIISLNLFDDVEKILNDYYHKLECLKDEMDINDIIAAVFIFAETYEYIIDKNKWNNIILHELTFVRDRINEESLGSGLALFGGLSELGLAIYILNKNTGYYTKLLKALNQIITNSLSDVIEQYIQEIPNLKMQYYDCITGISGIAAYLIHIEDKSNIPIIEKLLSYLVELTKKRNVDGNIVLGWHITSENQFRPDEKIRYPKGNFNFGLSHGVAGPLAVLSLAYKKGIHVNGHKQAISDIIEEYRLLAAYNSGCVYWPGQYSYENYLLNSKDFLMNDNRMSWCYGSIGILRALKLGAEAINDNDLLKWVTDNVSQIAQMSIDKYIFMSPTICHGYAGLLSLLTIEYRESNNQLLENRINELAKLIIDSYDKSLKYGFVNIDEDFINGSFQIIKTYNNSFLNGAAGILLSLISLLKKETMWEIHLLMK